MKEKIKKILKKSIVVLPALLFLTAYSGIPEKVTVMEGECADFGWAKYVPESTKQQDTLDAKLFNLIPIKTVDVAVMPKTYLVPSGEAIGVKLYTEGILVVGISDVKGKDGKSYAPAKNAGVLVGDRILAIDGEKIKDIDDFSDKINEKDGTVSLQVARENRTFVTNLQAVYSEESDCYKVGLWVRDSTAGIGTLTFYNPKDKTFGALGHAICDNDTKGIMTVKTGTVNRCRIRGVIKGRTGIAGELYGDFLGDEIGEITMNTPSGIAGNSHSTPANEQVMAASRFEVKKGDAEILCDVDGNGPLCYKIEITKVSRGGNGKNMVIKVTDDKLIQKTGGIVQGMSGSPILQNGKMVGAVTHVFVNDPTKGYGIFIENMLAEAEKIK